MAQIILASAAWYAFPKAIEYATSYPSSLESRVDRFRAKLFACKAALYGINYPNKLKTTFKVTSVIVSHMWLATLISPGLAMVTGFTDRYTYAFLNMAVCYVLFSSKVGMIKFINSEQGLDFITSEFGFRLVSTKFGLHLINQHFLKAPAGQRELLDILNRKLEYSAAQELLNAVPSNPPFTRFSIIEKIKFSKLLKNRGLHPISLYLRPYPENMQDTDPILCKIQCPILGRAPRSLVTDPTDHKTVYDHSTFESYLKNYDISPVTREKIPAGFKIRNEVGSRYDSIIRYRKACLQSGKLQDPQEFIANLRQVFAEILSLNDASDLKNASELVRDFFEEGFFTAYDVSYFKADPKLVKRLLEEIKDYPPAVERLTTGLKFHSHEFHRIQHNKDRYDEDMGHRSLTSKREFVKVSIDDFEQYPFMVDELNLEI
ncbi:MAG: hypothetical protein ACRCU0_07255 [Candidatus Rhabdochlamydia sp.]